MCAFLKGNKMLASQYPLWGWSWERGADIFNTDTVKKTSIKILQILLLDAKKVSALWLPSVAYMSFVQRSSWWIVAKISERQQVRETGDIQGGYHKTKNTWVGSAKKAILFLF